MPTHDTQNRARTVPEDSADSAGPASPEQHILQYRAEAAPHLRWDRLQWLSYQSAGIWRAPGLRRNSLQRYPAILRFTS